MDITHISNSFILIETEDLIIACDPWVGRANHGGWRSFPEYDSSELIAAVNVADYVYISHLHSDHFDPAFLKKSGLINKKFLIKHFENGVLRRRLENLGAADVIEIPGFEKFNLNQSVSVSIIPQMSSSKSEIDDEVNYDLDTSLVVQEGNAVLFNQVDNPLSESDFVEVNKYINKEHGKVTVAGLACGAAAEYPQCFIGIDREREKARIVEISLSKLKKNLQTLMPTCFFLAGGTYFIPGKMSALNRYIAQPSFKEVQTTADGITELLDLVGKNTLSLKSHHEYFVKDNVLKSLDENIQDAITKYKDEDFEYQEFEKPTITQLNQAFAESKANLFEKEQASGADFFMGTAVTFCLYEDFSVDAGLNISGNKVADFSLCSDQAITDKSMTIHLDSRAFYGSVTRKLIWNQVLSGSLCLFDRKPNIHIPSVLFSLNFLVIN